MSPLSGVVLVGAAAVSSPAFLAVGNGSLPVDVALTRFLVAIPIVWVALSLLAQLLPAPGTPAEQPATPEEPDTE